MITIPKLADKIYNRLREEGLTAEGAEAVLANIYAESAFIPNNLENYYESRLGFTDQAYTEAVDSGKYTRQQFINDSAGYGLCQWTYWTRKQGLYDLAKAQKKSIGDEDLQIDYIVKELKSYVWSTVTISRNLRECVEIVLKKFEAPADQSDSAVTRRFTYALAMHQRYSGTISLRQSVVGIARGWLGAKQYDAVHKEIVDTYNDHKPLARSYNLKYYDDWCAGFVSAVYIKAGIPELVPLEVGVGWIIRNAMTMGIWQERDDYVPLPGDWIVYDWDDSGIGDNVTGADHVGIVEECDGETFTVIEGNAGSPRQVLRRTMKVNGRYIRGFVVPDLGNAVEADPYIPQNWKTENVKARPAGKHRVHVFWAPVENAAGYLVYAIKESKYGYVLTTDDTEAYDENADIDINRYWVFPYKTNAAGKMFPGGCENPAEAKGVCPAVTELRATSVRGAAKILWKGVEGADGYLIYGIHPDEKYKYIGMTKLTTFSDVGADTEKYSYYWVFPYFDEDGKIIPGEVSEYTYARKL